MDKLMLILFIPIAIVFLILIIQYIINYCRFRKTAYYKITKNSYYNTLHDLGKFGEYKIYDYLKFYEEQGCKFLFNLYLPKGDGETTEIDVLMISPKGLFVFESKNYSGWIFGNEKYKEWTQTLPSGRGKSIKEKFFNPIMQNNVHIKSLKSVISDSYPIFSLIVFSERCTLKSITLTRQDAQVIKRNEINETLAAFFNSVASVMTNDDIEKVYNFLYPYTQVSDEVKIAHIKNIRKKYQTEKGEQNEITTILH